MANTNGFIKMAMGALVVVIVAAAVILPILAEAEKTTTTFENGRLYYMYGLGAEDSVTYTFDGTEWTADGEALDVVVSDSTTLVAGDGFIVRSNGLIRGSTNITPASITTMTVTAAGVTGTYVNSSDVSASINISGTVYYCATSEVTDYVLCPYNEAVYLNGDSEILADGQSAIKTGQAGVFKITGNITDGFTVTPQTLGVTVSDVVCNYEAVDGYIDLYEVTSITFTTVYDGETRAQTYSSYIVPAEVTAEKSVHATGVELTIIQILPVLVLVGVLMMIVTAFIANRRA